MLLGTMWWLAATATIMVPASAAAAAARPQAVAAEDGFAQLSRLTGRWRPADRSDSSLRIHFYLTANGTVLVESWERAGRPHSLTLYHRDGAALLATHYCPQGNQPRLVLAARDAEGLHFAFQDATDLDADAESHQHDLWLDLDESGHLIRSEIYRSRNGLGAPERLRLVRAE